MKLDSPSMTTAPRLSVYSSCSMYLWRWYDKFVPFDQINFVYMHIWNLSTHKQLEPHMGAYSSLWLINFILQPKMLFGHLMVSSVKDAIIKSVLHRPSDQQKRLAVHAPLSYITFTSFCIALLLGLLNQLIMNSFNQFTHGLKVCVTCTDANTSLMQPFAKSKWSSNSRNHSTCQLETTCKI